jgi:hypothetical protein
MHRTTSYDQSNIGKSNIITIFFKEYFFIINLKAKFNYNIKFFYQQLYEFIVYHKNRHKLNQRYFNIKLYFI